MTPSELWRFFPVGYLLTIAIETPVLVVGLSRRHAVSRRVLAGVWLTACTYPIVTLVLPLVFVNSSRNVYLLAAEVFAPVMECLLFWMAFGSKDPSGNKTIRRDFAVIVIANLASFAVGEVLNYWEWF
ncbi:MAG: hypothetical protein DMF69_03390 [Acidobacteria bacterium]|nr:MAG: hypothetical protein DMF69_03390 [Acidobacteriota bacterium]